MTFVEEFEGTISSVVIGEWQEDVSQGVWSLAEQCIDHNRMKRPTSTEVCLCVMVALSIKYVSSATPLPYTTPYTTTVGSQRAGGLGKDHTH